MKLRDIFAIIRSCFSYILILIFFLILFVPCLLLTLLLPAQRRYDSRLLFWLFDMSYKAVIKATFLPFRVTGRSNLPNGPAMYVANHQSSLDIPVLGSLLNGYPHVWYVLDYYAKKPVLKFFVDRLGVSVDRENLTRAARALIKGIRLIENKNRSIIIFPEGGRFNDKKVHEFLQGFAIIAKKTGRPVIPVFMPNNGEIYPPGSFVLHYKPIVVIIGEPFNYREDDTDDTFTERVYTWFLIQQQKY